MSFKWNLNNLTLGQLKENYKAEHLDQEMIEDYWLVQWGYNTYLENVKDVFLKAKK